MTNAEVKILPLIGKTLDSRDEATKLFEHLRSFCKYCGDLEIDFSEVDFMSRSFADQFHKEKLEWVKENNISIFFKNAPDQVLDILRAVSKTQKARIYKLDDISIHSFTKNDLISYLNKI